VSKKPSANKTEAPPDFEKVLAELEQIVERMELGELSLDESLKHFERGIALTRSCQSALQQAEQKVEILLRKSGGAEPFVTEEFSTSVEVESIENASDSDE
jgi:exodeoxyribonuclease VII small subunit